MHLPLGISELRKVQIVGSRTAQEKENEPTVAILAPLKSKGSFSLLLWHLTLPAKAQGMQELHKKAKFYNMHLLKMAKQRWRALVLVPSHQTRGTAPAHETSHGSPTLRSDPKDALGAPPQVVTP